MYEITAVSQETERATRQVVESASWPECDGLLVYPETQLGDLAGLTIWKGHRLQNGSFDGLWASGQPWEFAVLVDEALGAELDFPALFAWVLAHELGHALAGLRCTELLGLHVFVQENIRRASNGRVSTWLQLPFELTYDRFGLATVLRLFSRHELVSEVDRALSASSFVIDPARMKRLIGLDPLPTLPDMLACLRQFVHPYKAELRQLWTDQVRSEGERFICAGGDPSVLFD